jgi:predicted RNA-binding Zn-ribbon protein involved in translation (DUF1610 family)
MQKQILLRNVNKIRYCLDCNENVEIKIDGMVGRCPNSNCGHILYTIDNSKKVKEHGER